NELYRLFPEFLRVAAFRSSFHLISVSLILRNIDLHFFQPTSSAVRPYCLRSKTWESLRPHVHLCNNAR
ncbi:MAG: hypothetical protein VB125_01840, partial [Burkholderia sp.]